MDMKDKASTRNGVKTEKGVLGTWIVRIKCSSAHGQ